jgi:lipopolysaccharide transport system ATP-binding protein
MQDVSKEGRTILFVSHNTAAMLNLCKHGILLSSGRIQAYGEMPEVLRQYLSPFSEVNLFQPSSGIRAGDQRAIIEHFEVRPNPPQTGRPVEFTFSIYRPNSNKGDLWVGLAVGIRSEESVPLLKLDSGDVGPAFTISPGRTEITVRLEEFPITPGRYRMNIWMGVGQFPIDWIQDGMQLCVEPGPLVGDKYIETTDYPMVVPSVWEKSK